MTLGDLLDLLAFAAGVVLAGFLFGLGFLGAVEAWAWIAARREQP